MTTAVSAYVRYSTYRYWVLPLALLAYFTARSQIEPGPANWSYIGAALGLAGLMVASAIGGIAAFEAGRARRHGALHLQTLAVRSPLTLAAAEVVTAAATAVAAFWLAFAAFAIPTAVTGTWGQPPWLRLAADAAGLILAATLGWAAGRLVPRVWVPPVVTVVIFFVNQFLFTAGFFRVWRFLLPAYTDFYNQFTRLGNWVPAGQLLWSIAASVLVVVAITWWSARERIGTWIGRTVLGTSTAVAVVAAVVLGGQHGYYSGVHSLVVWTCSGDDPQICMHPVDESLGGRVRAEITPVVDRLAGTPFEVRRVEQRPRDGSAPTPGAVAFGLDDGRQISIELAAQDVAVNAVNGPADPCYFSNASADESAFNQIFLAWVYGTLQSVPAAKGSQSGFRQWLQTSTDTTVKAWVRSHADSIRACGLTDVPS